MGLMRGEFVIYTWMCPPCFEAAERLSLRERQAFIHHRCTFFYDVELGPYRRPPPSWFREAVQWYGYRGDDESMLTSELVQSAYDSLRSIVYSYIDVDERGTDLSGVAERRGPFDEP